MGIPPEVGPPAMAADELTELHRLAELAAERGMSPAEAVLHPPEDPIDGGAPAFARWRITDDRAAEWALRMVARAEEQLAVTAASADQWVRDVNAWEDAQSAKPKGTVAFFTEHLRQYALDYRDATGKATLNLPSGKVSTRPVAATLQVDDEPQLLAWVVERLPEAEAEQVAPTKRKPLVSQLKEVVRITEAIDRAHVVWTCGCVEDWDWQTMTEAQRMLRPWLPLLTEDLAELACPEHPDHLPDTDLTAVRGTLVALADDGEPVPGVAVVPAYISATVKAAQ